MPIWLEPRNGVICPLRSLHPPLRRPDGAQSHRPCVCRRRIDGRACRRYPCWQMPQGGVVRARILGRRRDCTETNIRSVEKLARSRSGQPRHPGATSWAGPEGQISRAETEMSRCASPATSEIDIAHPGGHKPEFSAGAGSIKPPALIIPFKRRCTSGWCRNLRLCSPMN